MPEFNANLAGSRAVESKSLHQRRSGKRRLSPIAWVMLVIAVAVILTIISWPAYRRWHVIRAIEEQGGKVGFAEESEWLTDWFGEVGKPLRDVRFVQMTARGPGSLDGIGSLREIRSLQWLDTMQVARSDIDTVHRLDDLTYLVLSGPAFTDEAVSNILRGGPRLTKVSLGETGASTLTMEAISEIPSIERLIFTAPHIEDADFIDLTPLPNLTEFSIGDSRIGDSGMEWLSHSPRLSLLEVMHGEMTDEGLRHVASMRNLKALHLLWCPRITSAGIAHVEGHPSIEELWVPATCVTSQFIESLRTMPSLRRLLVDGTIADPELREVLAREWSLEND